MAVCYELSWIIYCRYFHHLRSLPGPFVASVIYHASQGNMEHVQRRLHSKYDYLGRIASNKLICSSLSAIKVNTGQRKKSGFYDAWAHPSETGYPGHFPTRGKSSHGTQVSTLSKLIYGYAFDVLGELFYGQTFGMIETRSDVGTYMESIESFLLIFTIGGALLSYLTPVYLFYQISFSASLRGAIDATKKRHHLNDKPDILRKMLKIVTDRGEKVNVTTKHILVKSQSFLFAGADITFIALTSVLYYLMRYPVPRRKLVADIVSAFATGQLSDPIIYKEVITAPALSQGLHQRSDASAPGRCFSLPTSHPTGRSNNMRRLYGIPSGYRVGVKPAVVQYNQGIFGSDADRFYSDRVMMPFGAGSRTCIRKHIALRQVYKLVPLLLRKFDIRLVGEKE
ncbi:cytochrome P450 [Aspergillus spectabilis]